MRICFIGESFVCGAFDAYEPRSGRVKELSPEFARLCTALAVLYFDSYAALTETVEFKSDVESVGGTHPSAAGYIHWANCTGAWKPWHARLP